MLVIYENIETMTLTHYSKKHIIIIYPQLDMVGSGGQVIDFYFIQQLLNLKKFFYSYLLDKDVPSKSRLGYIYYTLCHLKEIGRNDIIFTNSRLYTTLFPCFLLLRLFYRNTKIITYHHHFNYYTRAGILRYIHKFFELNFLKTIDTIIIPSPYVRDEMKKNLPKANIQYIEIGFDPNTRFEEKKSKTNNLLYVGTVELRKRVHHLVSLAKFFKEQNIDFHINIVGVLSEVKYVASVQNMITDYQLQGYVSLLGRVDDKELDVLYKESDVFVFPSSHEGYGMVLVEALSYGLPIVAFNNSAMPYTIKNNYNGLLAFDNDIEDFCHKVKELLTDECLWRKLSHNAYQSALKVPTLQHMKDEMKQFIEGL